MIVLFKVIWFLLSVLRSHTPYNCISVFPTNLPGVHSVEIYVLSSKKRSILNSAMGNAFVRARKITHASISAFVLLLSDKTLLEGRA